LSFDRRNASQADPTKEERRWRIWRQQAAAKCWYRAEYAKEGDICFLGHLDFQRQLHLTLRRAGLPVAYSRGFHPHPLLKFGPPLPVGVAGAREVFDIAFLGETPGWEKLLNSVLPPGLEVRRSLPMGAVVSNAIDQSATRMDYTVVLLPATEGGPTEDEVRELRERFLASERWLYLRQRPKGDVEVDARALVTTDSLTLLGVEHEGEAEPGGTILRVSLLRKAGEVNLSIHDFLAALCGASLPEPRLCRIRRTGLYGLTTAGRWLTPLEEVGEENGRFWLRKRYLDA
jgi:radical SAM-linked protein